MPLIGQKVRNILEWNHILISSQILLVFLASKNKCKQTNCLAATRCYMLQPTVSTIGNNGNSEQILLFWVYTGGSIAPANVPVIEWTSFELLCLCLFLCTCGLCFLGCRSLNVLFIYIEFLTNVVFRTHKCSF